jgi:hypothetical protein
METLSSIMDGEPHGSFTKITDVPHITFPFSKVCSGLPTPGGLPAPLRQEVTEPAGRMSKFYLLQAFTGIYHYNAVKDKECIRQSHGLHFQPVLSPPLLDDTIMPQTPTVDPGASQVEGREKMKVLIIVLLLARLLGSISLKPV